MTGASEAALVTLYGFGLVATVHRGSTQRQIGQKDGRAVVRIFRIAGRPAFLEDRISPGKTNEGETHALITRTKGPSGVGEFLMIAGNASPDTFAAAEWLTQPWRARELVSRPRTRTGELPKLSGGDQGSVQAGHPGAEFLRPIITCCSAGTLPAAPALLPARLWQQR